ncbi:MAG TPA: glycosyltransferase family 4 protein [Candidatus Paceibacterota bacterium]|nr:glycosyltransferase family 4 protein [Candidatus Paceibacterota bacterium]
MHLALVTPLYPPEPGGPATYAKLLMEELPKRGIKVTLIKFSDVRHLPNMLRQAIFCIAVLRRARHADTILALDAVSVGWPSYVANVLLRKRFVVKVVGDHVWEQGRQRFGIEASLDVFTHTKPRLHPYLRFLQFLQRTVVRGAHAVIVPSNYLRDIVESWGVSKERVFTIYNAVTVDQVGTVPAAVSSLPRPLVVTAGRLVPWKGVGGVIDAVVGTGASLAVVGDGPEREHLEQHAGDMRQHTHTVGLKEFRYVFTGTLSHEDLLAVVQSADLFVLNSTYEGLSHLLLEAVALGTPTIATDAGGNREVLEGVSYGRLVPVSDVGVLSSTLKDMLASPPDRTPRTSATLDRMIAETVAQLQP